MTHSMGKSGTGKTSKILQTGKSTITLDPGSGRVTKILFDAHLFRNELSLYRLKLDFAPELIDYNDRDTLILQYIPSVTLYQYITCEPHFDFAPIARLHKRLHDQRREDGKALCHIDTNPRNYLYDGGNWRMIDFADCAMDDPEVDAIHFLLFLASEYPSAGFIDAVRSYLRGFPEKYIRLDVWNERLMEWIERFDERRRKFHSIEPSSNVKANRLWLNFSDPDDYFTKIFPEPS